MKLGYFLSVCAAITILGCGTNGDYKAQDGGGNGDEKPAPKPEPKPNPQTGYKNKGGLTGIVYRADTQLQTGSKVCFDTNTNGQCDDGESGETIYEGGKFSFDKTVSDANSGSILLATIKGKDTTSYLTSYEKNITPYTTLVVNETLYNPNSDKNKAKAKELLKNKFNFNLLEGGTSNSDEAKQMFTSFAKFVQKDTNGVYSGIANAIDEFYKQNSFLPTITINQQKPINQLGGNVFKLTSLSDSVTFTKTDNDETFMGASLGKDNLLSYSRWHNALRVVNLNSQSPSLSLEKKILHVNGARDTIDATTGASEQVLGKAVADDANNIFALIVSKGENTADATGVYKLDASSLNGNIEYAKYKKAGHFYQLLEGNDMALYNNTLLVGAKSGVSMFNTDNLTSPTSQKDIGNVQKVSLGKDLIFAGVKKRKANELIAFDKDLNQKALLNTNELTSSTQSYIYPRLIASFEKNVYFVLKDSGEIGKKVYCYEIKGGNFKLKQQLSLNSLVKHISISKDGKYLLATLNDKSVYVINTQDFTQTKLQTDEFIEQSYIKDNLVSMVTSQKVLFAKLKEEKGVITQELKDKWTNDHRPQ